MRKQNKSTQVGNRIILNGTALLLLAYMLAKIVQAYIVGGAGAPSVKVLLLGVAVLGGGIVFVVRYLVLLLKEYYRKPEDTQETQDDVGK